MNNIIQCTRVALNVEHGENKKIGSQKCALGWGGGNEDPGHTVCLHP
jgi:hypothetical protein